MFRAWARCGVKFHRPAAILVKAVELIRYKDRTRSRVEIEVRKDDYNSRITRYTDGARLGTRAASCTNLPQPAYVLSVRPTNQRRRDHAG